MSLSATATLKCYAHSTRSDSFVHWHRHTALLRSTSAFSPAVSPFANFATGGAASAAVAAPEGHVLTSTGQAGSTAGAGAGASAGGVGGLQNLKRDLVRLIGVMSFFDPASGGGPAHAQAQAQAQTDRDHRLARVRAVQDVVRESGGLLEVLNMTQLDENNPCECYASQPSTSSALPSLAAECGF